VHHRCPILMLVYNGWDDVIAGLTTMQSNVQNLWLIDNGSTIDRIDEVRLSFPNVRIILTGTNLGWAGGYNHAIGIADEEGFDTVYLLNSDAIPRADAVDQAVETLLTAPNVAAVGSMMLHLNGTRAFFDGDWHWDGTQVAPSLREDVREVRTIHGGGFALSLGAYRDIGPFHEDYFLYHEETDWCLRARAAGWRLLVDCKSRVDHEGEGSSTGFNRLYYIARNRFLAKRRGIALRDRKESAMSIIEYEYLGSIRQSHSERIAITNGLIDGLRGRFGQRRTIYPAMITAPLAALLPSVFRLKRKLRL
jgi:GT2 family glycosyltransferase